MWSHSISGKIMHYLWSTRMRFMDGETLRRISSEYNADYYSLIRYLLSRGYLIRVFRGLFYVKSPEEFVLKRMNHSPMELVAKALDFLGVKNWYFGLYTALYLGNMTHEFYPIVYVISDRIFRHKPVSIAGGRFKFIKVKPSLFFGIIKHNSIRYSDPEKTLLDFIYLWRYRGLSSNEIIASILEYWRDISWEKIYSYLKKYPHTVRRIVMRIRNEFI